MITILALVLATSFQRPGDLECNVRADHSVKVIRAYIRNLHNDAVQIRITEASLNACPITEKLPMTFTLGPSIARTFDFQPKDKSAWDWGSAVEMKYEVLQNSKQVSQRGISVLQDSGPGIGLHAQSFESEANLDVVLSGSGSTKDQIRGLVVKHAGLVIVNGLSKANMRLPNLNFARKPLLLPKLGKNGIYDVPADTNVSIASIPRNMGKLEYRIEWRASPWAKWEIESGVYEAN